MRRVGTHRRQGERAPFSVRLARVAGGVSAVVAGLILGNPLEGESLNNEANLSSAKNYVYEIDETACAPVDPGLVARYKSDKPLPERADAYKNDAAIDSLNGTDSNAEILRRANAALAGKIVLRTATEADHETPLSNRYSKDQPRVTKAEDVPPYAMRYAAAGILAAYNGMPKSIGTMGSGKPLEVILTTGFDTRDNNRSIAGEYYYEQGAIAIRIGGDAGFEAEVTKHETAHHVSVVANGGQEKCYMSDYNLQRPERLTTYSTRDPQRTKEVVAETFTLELSTHYEEAWPGAYQDPQNAANFDVMLAELAAAGQQDVADGLHNLSLAYAATR